MSDNIVGEVWKDIPNFEDRWQASSEGRIRSLSYTETTKAGWCRKQVGRVLVARPTSTSAYLRVSLGRDFEDFIHRLVAKTFLPNPNNLPEVNHIDKDVLNNRVDNLEWCTRKQNVSHSLGVPMSISKDGCLKTFESQAACSKFLSVNPATVSRFFRGVKYKTIKGWRISNV